MSREERLQQGSCFVRDEGVRISIGELVLAVCVLAILHCDLFVNLPSAEVWMHCKTLSNLHSGLASGGSRAHVLMMWSHKGCTDQEMSTPTPSHDMVFASGPAAGE